MPDHAATNQQPQVSSDRVIEILTREPMGTALWRAAVAEATAEAWQARCEQLEKASGVSDAKHP